MKQNVGFEFFGSRFETCCTTTQPRRVSKLAAHEQIVLTVVNWFMRKLLHSFLLFRISAAMEQELGPLPLCYRFQNSEGPTKTARASVTFRVVLLAVFGFHNSQLYAPKHSPCSFPVGADVNEDVSHRHSKCYGN